MPIQTGVRKGSETMFWIGPTTHGVVMTQSEMIDNYVVVCKRLYTEPEGKVREVLNYRSTRLVWAMFPDTKREAERRLDEWYAAMNEMGS